MALATALAIGGLALGGASLFHGMSEAQRGRERSEEGFRTQQEGYRLQQLGAGIQGEAARDRAQISRDQAGSSVEFSSRNRVLELAAAQQSFEAAQKSGEINKGIVQAELQNERFRMQAMELDARRKGTEVIRNQQRARALALASATAQGAGRGSGLQGGYGQISGQSNVNALGIQQNLDIGRGIFAQNSNISQARIAGNELEVLYAQQRAANVTARSQMAYDYAQANAGFQTRLADTETRMAEGAGIIAQGGGVVNFGQGQVNMGQALTQSGNMFMGAAGTIFNMGMTGSNFFGGTRTPTPTTVNYNSPLSLDPTNYGGRYFS